LAASAYGFGFAKYVKPATARPGQGGETKTPAKRCRKTHAARAVPEIFRQVAMRLILGLTAALCAVTSRNFKQGLSCKAINASIVFARAKIEANCQKLRPLVSNLNLSKHPRFERFYRHNLLFV
jgi:hypothetical protein